VGHCILEGLGLEVLLHWCGWRPLRASPSSDIGQRRTEAKAKAEEEAKIAKVHDPVPTTLSFVGASPFSVQAEKDLASKLSNTLSPQSGWEWLAVRFLTSDLAGSAGLHTADMDSPREQPEAEYEYEYADDETEVG